MPFPSMSLRALLPLFIGLMLSGCAAAPPATDAVWPRFRLSAEQVTVLNPPHGERFDASALWRTKAGELLTVNDRGPRIYRIEPRPGGAEADLRLVPDLFSPGQLAAIAPGKKGHYDAEGIAGDDQGRLYLCEEQNRWILRSDPKTGRVERLPIDWTPVRDFFSGADPNASFEGVAVGDGTLYVANERTAPVIIEVSLASLKVTGHFEVTPRQSSFFGTHYSDLSWHDGRLWVLCRQHRVVLQVDPRSHAVLAEFDYRAVEDALGYRKNLPVGLMEGLAVDHDFFWLLIDNNGFERPGGAGDARPTLVKCRRPDRK
jgi:Esterase-like activity of phytase